MGECIWELSDGIPCGVLTEATNKWCPFHKVRRVEPVGESLERVRDYAAATNRPFLDLSYVVFDKVNLATLALQYGKPLRFVECNFQECRFDGLCTEHEITFKNARFENTYFNNCEFQGKTVNFEECVFSGDRPAFTHVSFLPTEVFSLARATFQGCTGNFDEVYCRTKAVDLTQCTISADRLLVMICSEVEHFISHQLSINAEKIYFVDLRFDSHFEYMNHPKVKDIAPIALFSKISFSRMKSAVFIDANLERARFTYSVLKNVDFINVRWPQQNKRLILYDEIEPVKDTDSGDVLYTYTQLKRNYEENRAYEQAGDWHYREMELRRWSLPAATGSKLWRDLRRNFLSLYPWYELISCYGESYGRPLGLLVAVWIVFGSLYNCYSHAFDHSLSLAHILGGFSFSAAVMTLQYKALYSMGSHQHPILIMLQILLTAVILPLFLLALRRRFKR